VKDAIDQNKTFYIRADEPFQSLPAAPVTQDLSSRNMDTFASYLEERLSHKKVPEAQKTESK